MKEKMVICVFECNEFYHVLSGIFAMPKKHYDVMKQSTIGIDLGSALGEHSDIYYIENISKYISGNEADDIDISIMKAFGVLNTGTNPFDNFHADYMDNEFSNDELEVLMCNGFDFSPDTQLNGFDGFLEYMDMCSIVGRAIIYIP